MKLFIPEEKSIKEPLYHLTKKIIFEILRQSSIERYGDKCDEVNELIDKFFNVDPHYYVPEYEIFMESAFGLAIKKWTDQNLKEVELWKSVVIENAKINNQPHKVANDVIAEFRKEFTIEKEEAKVDYKTISLFEFIKIKLSKK